VLKFGYLQPFTLLAAFILALSSVPIFANPRDQIGLDNWITQQDVKGVRVIYEEIQAGLMNKRYKIITKRFDTESPSCSTYPVKSIALVKDDRNRVRKLFIEQIGSHRESFTIDRYYDINGVLRFVYVDRLISNVRIYLDSKGMVFWAVEKNNRETREYSSNNDDWETKPISASGALKEFQNKQLCPEITMQQK